MRSTGCAAVTLTLVGLLSTFPAAPASAAAAAPHTKTASAGPAGPGPRAIALEWPRVSVETRPWTRFWWMGSAVDTEGLRSFLAQLQKAGLGGVEITPIYGVRGLESRFVPYLSPAWVDRLETTLAEARRLGLGVDMATGTGWPFGGPWVGSDDACKTIAHRTWTVNGGDRLAEPVRFQQEAVLRTVGRKGEISELVEPIEKNKDLQQLAIDQVRFPKPLPLQLLMAYGESGEALDLTSRVRQDGQLDWTAPPGHWTLHALFLGSHGKMVERAAPGGEGNVIDHFSTASIRDYLRRFDEAFAGRKLEGLRAFFNDSYEVDDAAGQADWTGDLLEEFQRRRGYDLRQELPALFDGGDSERGARVLTDYRETMSELLLERFTTEWRRWANGRGAVVRNQAHGSPASILDLYAASDIPETEGATAYRLKWATSAANVSGKRLASAEVATWLGEHFVSTLADVRAAVDRDLLAGVNHVVYHGTSYAPPDAPWPGWPFYAAVHFEPTNTWWQDLGALDAYVTRVQSFLQAGRPDNDVLLYFPLHDALATRGRGLLTHFGEERRDLPGSPFDRAFDTLQARGYAFDFVSDRLLATVRTVPAEPGAARPRSGTASLLRADGGEYRVLVLPASRFVPLETVARALELARAGATVVTYAGLPADVPGLREVENRRGRLRQLVSGLAFGAKDARGVREAPLGKGRVLSGDDLDALLERAGLRRETLVDRGLGFVRRRSGAQRTYFISNPGKTAFEGWLPLGTGARSVALFDAMRGRRGLAVLRASGARSSEAYVQLEAGESLILVTHDRPVAGEAFAYVTPAAATQTLGGTWSVRFVSGGPELPPPFTSAELGSWTATGGEPNRAFSGTATYSLRFRRPQARACAFVLDLGGVRDSARVRLNGKPIATLIGPGYRATVGAADFVDDNLLEVEVTNQMANRVAALDRRHVPWKKFYNVNFAARLRENVGADGLFTAERWAPLDSGLLGPVTLQPVKLGPPARP